jgi:hypothetical protein
MALAGILAQQMRNSVDFLYDTGFSTLESLGNISGVHRFLCAPNFMVLFDVASCSCIAEACN